ncbi:FtsX-like permease family protein [Clostridium paraputrificum]|uniref:ABC transporter permease n=1 Tax=Clostridium TaxID=1485 RepID=UPI003D34B5F8
MLFKNACKLFKKKKFQLSAVGIIIFLSSFIYAAMFNATNSLEKTIESYFSEYVQEDFSVDMLNSLTKEEYMTLAKDNPSINPMLTLGDIKAIDTTIYNKIVENRKEAFEKEYSSYSLELRESKDISFNYKGDSCKLRVLKDNEKINLSKIEEGRKPSNNREIAVPRAFAEGRNLELGDNIPINNIEYRIVGLVLFPDYTLPMFGTDFILDSSSLNVALLSDEEFDSLKGKEEFRFGGIYEGSFDKKAFTENISKTLVDKEELNFITSVSPTTGNMRSGAILEDVRSGKAMTAGMSLMIAGIALLMVVLIVYKILQGEKAQIGVLKAIGYSSKEIGRPYIILITLIALPMLVIGCISGLFAGEPLKELYLVFYLLPKEPMSISYSIILVAVLLPLTFFIGCSYFIISKMLKKKPLDLLKVGDEGKVNRLTKWADKILSKAKTTTKFKYSFLLRNSGKFFVFLLGIVSASMLIIMGLMMPGFFSKMSTDKYNKVDYKYEAVVDVTKASSQLKDGEEKILTVPNGKYEDNNITIQGLEINNKLYKLYNKKEKDITKELEDGVIITKSFNMFYDTKVGDSITVNINNKDYDLEVKGMSDEYGEATIYMNREELSEIVTDNMSKDLFTGIYSGNEINKDDYAVVINKSDILDQTKSMQRFIYISIGGILGSAIFISALILYVLTSLTVEDNYYNISLLKVMGYSKKEVNSMILNSYLGYSIVSYIISIPLTVWTIDWFVGYLSKSFNMVLPLEFALWQGGVGLIVILIIFYIGSISAKRKIDSISLQEVLKEYRE